MNLLVLAAAGASAALIATGAIHTTNFSPLLARHLPHPRDAHVLELDILEAIENVCVLR